MESKDCVERHKISYQSTTVVLLSDTVRVLLTFKQTTPCNRTVLKFCITLYGVTFTRKIGQIKTGRMISTRGSH